VRVRARRSRYSVMEQNLRKASEKLAATLPAQATIIVLPTTDDGDHFTHLGYEAQG
jgi:lysophospholipase L1-like esterase